MILCIHIDSNQMHPSHNQNLELELPDSDSPEDTDTQSSAPASTATQRSIAPLLLLQSVSPLLSSALSVLLCRVSSGGLGRARCVMNPSGTSSSRSWMPTLHQRPCIGVGARSSPQPGGCATALSSWPPLASWSLSTM